MFTNLVQFVTAHRPCGELTSDVGELTRTGYALRLVCVCGAAFERWVTPSDADEDLLCSRLSALAN